MKFAFFGKNSLVKIFFEGDKMLKGINKHIIEICDINNPHFYKAILFVRPESDEYDISELEEDANKILADSGYLTEIAPSGYLRRRERRKKRIILSCGIASFLLVAAGVVIFIL